jgi:uncharacterized membrane protein required for colicin V production
VSIADLVLLLLLGLGFFVGFFRGLIRALLAIAAWAVSFLLAANIRAPIGDWLARSASFDAFYADMIAFAVVFFAVFIALLLVITFSRSPTSITGHAVVDDIFGGVVGVIVVVLVVAAVQIMLASYYRVENPPASVDLGAIAELHRALLGSTIATYIANTVVHWIAFLFGPLLPPELLQVIA